MFENNLIPRNMNVHVQRLSGSASVNLFPAGQTFDDEEDISSVLEDDYANEFYMNTPQLPDSQTTSSSTSSSRNSDNPSTNSNEKKRKTTPTFIGFSENKKLILDIENRKLDIEEKKLIDSKESRDLLAKVVGDTATANNAILQVLKSTIELLKELKNDKK